MKKVSYYKYLRILIGANVNFNEHVARLYSKLSTMSGALHRLRKQLTAAQHEIAKLCCFYRNVKERKVEPAALRFIIKPT